MERQASTFEKKGRQASLKNKKINSYEKRKKASSITYERYQPE